MIVGLLCGVSVLMICLFLCRLGFGSVLCLGCSNWCLSGIYVV